MYEALSIKLKTDVDASTSTASIVQYDDLSESSSSTPATSSTTSPSTSMIESSSPESEPKSPRAEPRCSIAESDCPITLSHSPNMKPESTEHHDDQDCDFPPTKRRKVPVEEMLTSLMTMDPPAQFELWRRMLQSHPFDLEQLNILKTIIKNRLKLDIVSSVPCEIAAYIMSFLSPRDLCQAAQTCRSWRIICDDNRLWRQKCSDEGLLNDRQILSVIMERHIAQKNVIQEKFASEYTSATVPKNHWKSAYSRHINILRNWNTREFHITEPVPADRPRQTALRTRPRPANVEARMVISAQLARLEQPIPQQQVARVRQAPVYRIYPLPNRPVERLQPQHQPQQQQLQDQPQAIAQPRPEQPAQESQQEAQPADSAKDQSTDNQNEARPCLMTLRCHEESVITCLQYNHETNILVSGSDDQTLKVWCSETGRCLSTLEGHQGGVWASQLSPDDMVISGSTDRTLRVWEARTGKLIHTLHGHTSTVRCLALCGDQVVSGSRDTTLRLWDIKQGRCLNVFLGHTAAVRCVEFKGDRIVSGAYDHLVMVWDATTGEMLHSLECHENRIYSLQYDGKIIASGSLDSTICIWDAKTGQLRHRLTGHSSLTSKMHLKGKILVSANADQTCKIWDIETGECLKTLENKHTSAVTSVFVNDWHVVTSSDDGTVRLWDIKTGEYLRDLVVLPSAVRGGVVWRIRASYTKLICAVGSRNTTPTDDTRLLVLDFK